jgi:hypothetical protein
VTIDTADKQARTALLRAAVANVAAEELRAAMSDVSDIPTAASVAARNAWNALRRHRNPAAVFERPQYRAALPYVAASVADECLAKTVDLLGEHSEHPTREQLLEALDEVRTSFPDTTVAVMLASVAYDDLPSSRLCAELLADDPRFGLTGLEVTPDPPLTTGPEEPAERTAATSGLSPEQRAARRAKKEKVKVERRKKAEAAQRAGDEMRQRRRQERTRPG